MPAAEAPTRTLPQSLAPSAILDSDHPAVRAFAELHAERAAAPTEAARAIALYYAVRDGIRYDPYSAALSVETLRASATLERGRGWCVSKAVLLAAACRAVGIPARLGFADVRNHLSTQRMRDHMQTDVFYYHGYTSIGFDGGTRWVKATPAFNIELCEKFGILPLDFDAEHDSLYHPFDREGRQHMEYLHDRGEYDDVPLDEILATFAEHYPHIGLGADGRETGMGEGADFDRDVERETGDLPGA